MANFAAFLAAVVAIAYLGVLVFGLVAAFPYGIPGLFIVGGFLGIFLSVVRQRAISKEDDYYSKNVEK